MSRRDERGTTAVLIVGFFLVLALLVGVVVDASSAYLQRQALDNLADGAALAAADGAKADQVYAGGVDAPIELDSARRYAFAYLDQLHAGRRFAGLEIDVSLVGRSVVVTVRAPVHLAIAPPGWEAGSVTAQGAAYVVIGG